MEADYVPLEITLQCSPKVANVTGKRFLSSVGPKVTPEVCSKTEPLETKWTLVDYSSSIIFWRRYNWCPFWCWWQGRRHTRQGQDPFITIASAIVVSSLKQGDHLHSLRKLPKNPNLMLFKYDNNLSFLRTNCNWQHLYHIGDKNPISKPF